MLSTVPRRPLPETQLTAAQDADIVAFHEEHGIEGVRALYRLYLHMTQRATAAEHRVKELEQRTGVKASGVRL